MSEEVEVDEVVPADELFGIEGELDNEEEEAIDVEVVDRISGEGTEEDRCLIGGLGGALLGEGGLIEFLGAVSFKGDAPSGGLECVEIVAVSARPKDFVGVLDRGGYGGVGEATISPCDLEVRCAGKKGIHDSIFLTCWCFWRGYRSRSSRGCYS